MIIVDPEGFIITPGTWDGPMEYQIYDINGDGELDDIVVTGERKIGDYLITIVPEPDVLPTDTYSLEVVAAGITTVLAEDVPISEIPDEPYTIEFIPASIDFNPDTLNLKSNGKWITVYIELPTDYDVNRIDLESIRLNGQIQAETKPTKTWDYDNDGIPDLMVKFDRSAVQDILEAGDEVIITGKLTDIVYFESSDTIKVIDKDKKK